MGFSCTGQHQLLEARFHFQVAQWALVSSGPADMVWPVVLVCLPATATMSASQESALLLRIAMLPVSPGVENGGWSGTSSTQA
ncbi:hypothetical protein V6N12_010603 [Hibiscus sabdariffa]|uniref:Uncharacterized protein n=1 Tax=Hibiscus sabdariffa TaxID=183260 RepID=A0ABR2EKK6_9ROSI